MRIFKQHGCIFCEKCDNYRSDMEGNWCAWVIETRATYAGMRRRYKIGTPSWLNRHNNCKGFVPLDKHPGKRDIIVNEDNTLSGDPGE